MNNDLKSKNIGISIINIKMFDCTVRIITNVQHVLILRKNLILLSKLKDTFCTHRVGKAM